MKILSLFDGISVAKVALDRLNIECEYYASEIDKYAIAVSTFNHPSIIRLGDIKDIDIVTLPVFDLVIGGFPCQSFSFAGKGLGFNDERGKLFLVMIDLLSKIKYKHFLFENVHMKLEFQDAISKMLKIEPIRINSKLVSAQNRPRLYWTNIITNVPADLGLTFGDIFQLGTKDLYYSEKALQWIERHSKRRNKKFKVWNYNTKVPCLTSTMYKKYSSQRFFGILDIKGLRYISPVECERCQTLNDEYTTMGNFNGTIKKISNTQRYKMLGNSFTTDVIKHIVGGL